METYPERRFLFSGELRVDELILPRGVLEKATEILISSGASVVIQDERIRGKRLTLAFQGERVWKEVLSVIERPSHRSPLFNAIRALQDPKLGVRELERNDIELITTGEKLANLARRITDLPVGVPADAFYDEMKRLGANQTRLKAQLNEVRQRGEEQRIASVPEYERLLSKLRDHLADISPESKRRIIQALIQKVVVTKSGFELHYFAGVDQIKMGEALASPSFSLAKKISGLGSFKQLNGWSDRD